MKTTSTTLLPLLFLFFPLITAMEPNPHERLVAEHQQTMDNVQNIDLDELANKIDQAIEKEFAIISKMPYFNSLFATNQKMLDIFKVVEEHTPGIPQIHDLYEKLFVKNRLFKEAIDYFLEITKKDFNEVNGESIDYLLGLKKNITLHPNSETSLTQINLYILSKAKAAFFATQKTDYQLILTGHTAKINQVTLDVKLMQAATASDDATARLWCFKTGKCLHILNHSQAVKSAYYNCHGDLHQLATCTETPDVNIWNPVTGKHMFIITFPNQIYEISFSGKLLIAAAAEKFHFYLTDSSDKSNPIENFFLCYTKHSSFNQASNGNYMITTNNKANEAIMTKRNPSLALCKKALKNSFAKPDSLDALLTSQAITDLTPLEKELFQNEIVLLTQK